MSGEKRVTPPAAEVKVSLYIAGWEGDPVKISVLLGLTPTRVWTKGEPVPGTLLVRKRNHWILDADAEATVPFTQQVEALLDRISIASDAFSKLPAGAEIQLYCVVYDINRATDLTLPRRAVNLAARIGASISIIYYDMTDWNDDQSCFND